MCGKDQTQLPVPNLLLCHWSSQLFDLHALSSTDIRTLLLNQLNLYCNDCHSFINFILFFTRDLNSASGEPMDSDFHNNNATNCKSGVKRRAVDDIQNNISQVIESVIATSVNLVVLIFSCFSFEHKFNDESK